MSVLFDTCPTFVDDIGKPLAGGRLVVYKYLTTDLADIYADSDYVTPANNPFALDNAGTMPFNLFMQESVTVHAQKFIGYDENNVEMYADQKVFNIIVDSDSVTGTTVGYLNSIADLRSYAVEHGKSVTVTGYFTSGDCPSRVFQYDENSSALDNNGSIIESSLTASGRWIWVPEGPTIDCRTFGVIAGSNNINANFTSFINYCASAEKIGYIPNGNYNLTQSGSIEAHCALLVDEAVKINSTGTYVITLRNGRSLLKGTFAGTNIVLRIYESSDAINSWVIGNPVPIEAFETQQHSTSSNVAYNIRFSSSQTFVVSGSQSWNSFIVNGNVDLQLDGVFNANKLEGTGTISLGSPYNALILPEFKTSQLANDTSTLRYMSEACTDKIYLDTDVTYTNGTVISALIISTGTITHSGTITVSGGIEGRHNTFLSDAAVNVGYRDLDNDFWASASGLVKSFNASIGVPILDMGGASAPLTDVTRGGTLRNGTVRRVVCNASVKLENMTIQTNIANVPVSATSIDARNTTFNTLGNSNFFGTNFESGTFVDCVITNSGNDELVVNATNCRFDNVAITGYGTSFKITGGSSYLNNVNAINVLTLIPGSDNLLGNIFVDKCSINTINLDATQMANVAEAIAYNILIKNCVYLPGNINAINNSSKKWAVNGHYNIQIGDNEGADTRRTYGSSTANVGLWSGDTGVINSMKMFIFNTAASTGITSGRLFACYSNTSNAWAAMPYILSPETDVLQSSFIGAPAFRARRLYGTPTTSNACIVNFEVYR